MKTSILTSMLLATCTIFLNQAGGQETNNQQAANSANANQQTPVKKVGFRLAN